MNISADSVVILALDTALTHEKKGKKTTEYLREYTVARGSDFISSKTTAFMPHLEKKNVFSGKTDTLTKSAKKCFIVIYPTRTYSKGFGGGMFSDMAPEDRAIIRKAESRFGKANVEACRVSLKDTRFFDQAKDFFNDEEQHAHYKNEQKNYVVPTGEKQVEEKRPLIQFDFSYIKNSGQIFKSVMTKPNKQDVFYLITKTFGVNLAVRMAFGIISVQATGMTFFQTIQQILLKILPPGTQLGTQPLVRFYASQLWYLFQDIVFTIFGQTYMKFLGRMSGMFRVYKAYIGDFLFVYIQFVFFEFLNRLILGPIGENPLVYTWKGIGLILLNNFQGLISGGIMMPAINKMREAGLISHSMMMHFYQLGSLCFYFGLFAAYGFQKFYMILTTTQLVFAWGAFIIVSVFYKETFVKIETQTAAYDGVAAECYRVKKA